MTKFLFPILSIAVLLTGCASSGVPTLNDTTNTDSDLPSIDSSQATEETQDDSDSDSESESSEPDMVEMEQSPQVSVTEFEAAVANADVDYDEFEEETSFTVVPEFELEDRALFYLTVYLQSDGGFDTNLNTAYLGKDWLFFEFLDFRFKDETHEIYQAQSFEKYTEVLSGGYVQELFIHELTREQIDLMEDIVAEGGAKLRLLGDGDSVQRDFTASEIDAFKTILTIHRGLEQGLEYQKGA